MRARFTHGWAFPATPNAIHNLGLLGDYRLPVQMPRSGNFSPNSRCILAEGPSTKELVDICLEHSAPIIPTTLIHDSGPASGWGPTGAYHGANGRGRGPYTSTASARRSARGQFAYYRARGVEVVATAYGNELSYSQRNTGDWQGYLDSIIDAALAFRQESIAAFGSGVPVILGCNHGKARHNGRKTLVQEVIDRGLQDEFLIDIHGNGKTIPQMMGEIQWARARGCRVVVMEDRNEGPDNDAFERCRAFSNAGALWAGQFGSRNVDAAGDNPGCLWGTSSNKRTRRTGAGWTCAGYLDEEFMRLDQAAIWCGNVRQGTFLPDDTEEEPMPDPDKALGEDKMMAMLQAHSASVHGATQAARDRALVRAKKFYREWYALVVGIPAALAQPPEGEE